jgi:type IV pilus assembly protein PilM
MRRIELPPLKDAAEIRQAVQFQAQDAIPMPLDTVVLDYHTLGIVEREAGPRLQVLLVAARRDMVERVLQAVRLAGLQPEGVDLAAFGMIRALHPADAGADERVLYLAVGGLTNLAISRGLICEFTRVIPAGVEQMAADVASRCAIDIDEARRLLASSSPVAESASPTHSDLAASHDAAVSEVSRTATVRTAIDEGVRRIGSEVRNSIDFYLTAQDAAPVGRAVLTGTALEIPGFVEALSRELDIAVERGEVAAAQATDVPASLLPVAAGLSVPEGRL